MRQLLNKLILITKGYQKVLKKEERSAPFQVVRIASNHNNSHLNFLIIDYQRAALNKLVSFCVAKLSLDIY